MRSRRIEWEEGGTDVEAGALLVVEFPVVYCTLPIENTFRRGVEPLLRQQL